MRIEGMVKRFGGLTAVDQVDLAIPAGRLCGLIGANGAGKTTLFNLITGIEAPTNGKVFFRDRELTGLKMEDRAAAGIIRTFQRTRLFLSMTVLENVMAGMALHFRNGALDALVRPRRVRNDEAEARRLAVALVHLVGLAGREFEPCRNLPYGHRRLVELARALAARPAVLLLDEPAAGLNHEERQHLQGLIRRLRDEFGLTIVLVEHHLSLVLQTCDRVVVLHHGRKIAEDVPGRIVQNDQVIEAYLGTRRRVLDA
ncbi:MAG: ABC transporter ATP-binding protein [Firmicutes bacterium]|nr:ABC transporter ATP-binding protein [Bacillota bacterium]